MPIPLNQKINSSSNEFIAIAQNLQGNILAPHGRDHAAHIFINFKDAVKARKLISNKITPKITSAKQQKLDSEDYKSGKSNGYRRFLSFSLSHQGYAFINLETKAPNDRSFKSGMKLSSLNDPNVSNWQIEFQKNWHALIVISNASAKILKNNIKSLKRILTNDVIEFLHIENGLGIKNSEGNHIEHFGYVDGISQPHMLTDRIDSGKVSTNNWNPAANLDLALVKDPGGTEEDSLGSFFVFRKLEQNVKAFKKAESDLAQKIGTSIEYAGAQMVGRYRNGTPLIPISPPQPTSAGKMNDFNYSSDTNSASKCPFGAHTRKTNPRGGMAINMPQFPRRGITFGKKPVEGSNDPEKGVGLLFMAYNSNISSQFEFMQRSWANNVNFPASSTGIDSIIGQGNLGSGQNYFKKWGDDTSKMNVKPSLGNFVTMKGGEYFFTPSISFLKSL